jgi:hypothetical protein
MASAAGLPCDIDPALCAALRQQKTGETAATVLLTWSWWLGRPGLEIRGRYVIRDHHFFGKDDHVLTDGSPSDDLIFAPFIWL